MIDHQRVLASHAIERYLLGEMTVGERDEFEAHYFECPACANEVREGAQFTSELKHALATPAETPRESFWTFVLGVFRTPVWIPAAAAAMGVIVLYQNVVTIPALRTATQPQALSTGILRVVRSAAETVIRPGGSFIHLVAPVEASDGTTLVCEVVAAGANARLARVEAPVTGGEVSLLLPSSRFPDGRYMLVLTPSDGRRAPERRPFRIGRG